MSNIKRKNDIDDLIADMGLGPEPTLELADPSLVSFYKDYNNRIIWLDKDISDNLFAEIRMILQFNREDEQAGIKPEKRKPIKLMIQSYGGNLDACYAMIDVINLSKTPVYTVNLQCAMSSGCLILLNGHKRYCMPMSQALIHSGSGNQGGSFEQVVAQTDNYKKLIEMMKENILSHTKIDSKLFTKWRGKETYLYAEDQVKYGLVDEIITDINDII